MSRVSDGDVERQISLGLKAEFRACSLHESCIENHDVSA